LGVCIRIEKEEYYNKNGWSIEAKEVIYGEDGFENQLINREREVQRQLEKNPKGVMRDIKK